MKAALMLIYPAPILCRIIEILQVIRDEPLTLYYQYPMGKIRPGYDWQDPDELKMTRLSSPGKYRELLGHDLILIHGIWTNALTYLVYALACLLGKKVINLTEAENRYTGRPWKRLLKRLSVAFLPKSRTFFLCLGGYPACVEDYVKYGFREERFYPFAYCGALEEPDRMLVKWHKGGERLNLLYVGELHHRKGVDVLLKSLARTDSNAYKMKICGRGPMEDELKRLCQELEIQEKVHFAGHLDKASLGKAYREADLFILPSRFDGYGAVLNEAAAHSLPLVASDQVMAGHTFIHVGINGFVFKDERQLTKILLAVFNKPEMLAEMRKQSFLLSQKLSPLELAKALDSYIMKAWRKK